jgi:HPt (histidine-containing phosphotransfer) domain-containing protein
VNEPDGRPGQANQPALDEQIVRDLRRLQAEYANPQFLQQLVQIFTANAPRRMEQIRAAIAATDARALEHTAHTLKSNCAMLGASRMAAYCHDLERHGEAGAFVEAREVLALAEAEFPRVIEAVGALTSGERPSDGG